MSTGGPVVARERLYLTRDKTRLVPADDPDAWTLFCTPGSLVPREQAARFGLLEPVEPASREAAGDGQEQDQKQRPAQAKPRTARTKPRDVSTTKKTPSAGTAKGDT
jgi:hypothetical protein